MSLGQTHFVPGTNPVCPGTFLGGRKTAQETKTNSWERRFPGTFRTNVPLILPIFSVFSVGGGPKVPRNFVPGNFFFLILGGFSPCEFPGCPKSNRIKKFMFMCLFLAQIYTPILCDEVPRKHPKGSLPLSWWAGDSQTNVSQIRANRFAKKKYLSQIFLSLLFWISLLFSLQGLSLLFERFSLLSHGF